MVKDRNATGKQSFLELKAAFNSTSNASITSPEEEQLRRDLEKSHSGDPEHNLAGRQAPDNATKDRIENNPRDKSKKERERQFQVLVWQNILEALRAQIEELTRRIDELQEDLAKIHDRLVQLGEDMDAREHEISTLSAALRQDTIPRHPDGTIKDERVNNYLIEHLRRVGLPVENLSAYSESANRGFLDAELDYQREELNHDHLERQALTFQADEKSEAFTRTMADRAKLQAVIERHEEILSTVPENEQAEALETLYEGLEETSRENLQRARMNENSSDEVLKKQNSQSINASESSRQAGNFTKDQAAGLGLGISR